MFGRAYRGGPSKDLALRMKAGQQLVYRRADRLARSGRSPRERQRRVSASGRAVAACVRRYFYAGEMARPPRLLGTIPRVTADWQWSGYWPVTTDALLAGAWRLPKEKKLVLLLVM